jgi:predicted amidohydrolase
VNEAARREVLPAAVTRMLDRLGRAAAKHRMYLVMCSDHLEADGGIYNTAFLLGRDGREIGRYHKVCPTWGESGARQRGTDFPVFSTPDLGTAGVLICYDLVMPETARCLALQGADIIFFPTMGGAAIGDGDIGVQALRVRAVENFVYLVVAHRGSGAMIISPQGKIISQAEGPDGLAVADIDPHGGREGGDSINWQHDMRARLFRERNPAAFALLTVPKPPVLAKVPIALTSEEAGRIMSRMLTVGEEEFKQAAALAAAGKIDEAVAAFEKLCTEYPATWIDRVARERLASLRARQHKRSPPSEGKPVPKLGISGDKFTINGQPQFLLGVSYFDFLDWRVSDLDDLWARRFNLVRIFMDWETRNGNSQQSCFDNQGNLVRQQELLAFVRACGSRGIMVDVTVLESTDSIPSDRERAIRAAVRALSTESNVFFDLVNEHNGWLQNGTALATTSPHSVMKSLMTAARQESASAILTFSSGDFWFAGRSHLLTNDTTALPENINEELDAGVQILAPHLPRSSDWFDRTDERVRALKNHLAAVGRSIPVYLQEEQRRGDGSAGSSNSVTKEQFLQAAREARDAGAAAWVFHTDAGFDLRSSAFVKNLDSVEKQVFDSLGVEVFGATAPPARTEPALLRTGGAQSQGRRVGADSSGGHSAAMAQEPAKTADKLRPLDYGQVEVGGEMGRRIKITVENSLLNLDIDGNFLKPFLEKQTKKGSYLGLGLLIDATVRFAAYTRDARVITLKRHLVGKLIAAQTADGYLGEFVPAQRIWGWIDIQELAYVMNGLLSDYHFFKEVGSLAAARKQADYILAHWDEKPNDWPAKWGSLHMVTTGLDRFLFLLSEETGDARYRDFCITKLGVPKWNGKITLGRWGKYDGHVYGDLARYVAQLDWYRRQPDEALLVPTRRAVDFMLRGDGMVITGICGDWECWHNTQAGTINLAETCSTTYVLKMMDSLLRLNGDSVYGDVMERTIFNGLFSAQSPDGRRIRYFTAFDGPRRYWTGVADIGRRSTIRQKQQPTPAELAAGDTYCCPNNYRRAISDLPALIYYRTSEGVAVNLFTESSATVELREGVRLAIKQQTDYPNSGNVKLHLEPSRPSEFPLQLRIPRWCSNAEIRVNGKLVEGPIPSGAFFTLRETWKPGGQVELRLPMSWRLIKGRQSQVGRVAIVRGPMIYSLSPARHKELQGVDLRLLTLDPSSIEGPFPDSTVRPNGLACKVRAWRPGVAYPDAKTDYQLVLTECPDPDGEAIYFGVPNPNAKEFVADELMGHHEHK